MEHFKGEVVGSYALETLLGRGSFGEVWTARHREWPERIEAVKFPSDSTGIARLKSEASVLRTLKHPNIVKVLDIDTLGEKPHMRREYVEGSSLDEILRKGPMDPQAALRMVREVLDALSFAHSRGVIHRDVKPANIIMGASGQAKLADFGLAARPTDFKALAASLGSSEAPMAAGTLEYMAPEILDGAEPSASSDVYSLGKVFYQALSGIKHSGLKPPSSINASVPAWMDAIAARMLDAPGERYATADEAIADIGSQGSAGAGANASAAARSGFPVGDVAYMVPIALLAALAANVRAFGSPLAIAGAAVCLVAAVVLARFSRAPVVMAVFWSGLVFGFLGARLHWSVMWLGMGASSVAAIVGLARAIARGGGRVRA